MADNTTLNPGNGGDTIRDIDRAGVKTQVVALDANPGGAESLLTAGQKAKAASVPVTLASDEDALALFGPVTEAAPATDTASSGLNGRLQRIAQRLTSLIALLPASIGQKAKVGSLSVALASDDDSLALLGPVSEVAPATDTASSGHNGRLQRIAQRLTSIIALLPASIGQKASTGSLSVVLASDQGSITTVATAPSGSSRLLSAAASTNATSVKGSAGTIKAIQGYNAKASPVYLKLYNKATAPTVGTDTPVKTIYLPPSSAFALDFSFGFSVGIAYALTGAAADNDATALAAGDILCLNVDYI